MTVFKPTWLYIKQHNKTGLKYFGMTTKSKVNKYPGSGKYWKLHLAQHGNDVSTVWVQLFESAGELIQYATTFSIENDIVNSTDWANLVPESGVHGKSHSLGGWSHTPEARKRISASMKGKTPTSGMLGQNQSADTKRKISDSLVGRKFAKNYNSKCWKIVSDGTTEYVKNLRLWCTNNNLSYGLVHRNAKAARPYRGYQITEADINESFNLSPTIT